MKVTVKTGPVITQITQTWSDWASLTTRLVSGSAWLHQEWTVGPIPLGDHVGKEIVVRTSTDMETGRSICWHGVFLTSTMTSRRLTSSVV